MELSQLGERGEEAVRRVAATGREEILTEGGREVAVIISAEDYERLHAHADEVDGGRLRFARGLEAAAIAATEEFRRADPAGWAAYLDEAKRTGA